jgi:protein-tyrosine phosphatase
MTPYRICFVCLGNICRSPSAEIVMRALLEAEGLAERVEVSSAGLGDWHVGELADPRTRQALDARGYDGSRHRARQWDASWFDQLDLVVAMDASQVDELRAMAPADAADRVRPLLPDRDVPDPYYGGDGGFAAVLDLVERGCHDLLEEIRPRLAS